MQLLLSSQFHHVGTTAEPMMTSMNHQRTTIQASPQWHRIDFLSDTHLNSTRTSTWQAFESHILHTPADAIFLLGDIADVWVGDDAIAEPGFERHLATLLRQSASCRYLAFLPGNRDFFLGNTGISGVNLVPGNDGMFSRLPDACRLDAFGQQLLLVHGDAECLADTQYQSLRAQFRDPAWQANFLALPLSQRRAFAQEARRLSMAAHQKSQRNELWADLDDRRCIELLTRTGAQTMIHGHTHRPGVHTLTNGAKRWTLSDWDFTTSPPRGDVLTLTNAGLERTTPVTHKQATVR